MMVSSVSRGSDIPPYMPEHLFHYIAGECSAVVGDNIIMTLSLHGKRSGFS
ncbi:MAG: hypothetical protein WCL46_06135 [Chlorobium sp.]